MTEEPQSPQPPREAVPGAQIESQPVQSGASLRAKPMLSLEQGSSASLEPQLEEIQQIPGGRIRRWDDGEITVALGEFHLNTAC